MKTKNVAKLKRENLAVGYMILAFGTASFLLGLRGPVETWHEKLVYLALGICMFTVSRLRNKILDLKATLEAKSLSATTKMDKESDS